jgi:hypothetical protein
VNFDIVPFDKNKHNREGFDCGEPELNEYLLSQADKDIGANAARLFVATTPESNDILGYYTISNTAVDKRSFPETDGLPRYMDLKIPLELYTGHKTKLNSLMIFS